MQGQFDIIVIGSGLGGLECGAMLARSGQRHDVECLVERPQAQ